MACASLFNCPKSRSYRNRLSSRERNANERRCTLGVGEIRTFFTSAAAFEESGEFEEEFEEDWSRSDEEPNSPATSEARNHSRNTYRRATALLTACLARDICGFSICGFSREFGGLEIYIYLGRDTTRSIDEVWLSKHAYQSYPNRTRDGPSRYGAIVKPAPPVWRGQVKEGVPSSCIVLRFLQLMQREQRPGTIEDSTFGARERS